MTTPVIISLQVAGVADIQRALRTVDQSIADMERAATRTKESGVRVRARLIKTEADETTKAAKQAAKAVEDEEKRKNSIREKSATMAGQLARKAASEELREVQRAEAAKTREAERSARFRERLVTNSALMAGRAAERQANEEIAAMKRTQEARRRFAAGMGGPGARSVGRVASGAASMLFGAMSVGAGFAVADAARDEIAVDRQAALLSNSAYNPLDTNTRRRDPKELIAKARAIGIGANVRKADVLSGLTEYVRLSSDASILDAGNTTGADLAKLAKATGTDFTELMKMTGNARVQNKNLDAAGIMTLMRSVVGQGKAGAVELEDLVKSGGEIMSTSGKYAGEQTANQGRLIGLAQFGRRVTDVAESATAVRHLASDVSTHADKMELAGIHVKARDASGKVTRGLADPAEIIANLMAQTNGDTGKLKKLGIGDRSMRLFDAASLMYNPAYESASGKPESVRRKLAANAVREEIGGLENASYKQSDIDADFAAVMKTNGEKFDAAITRIRETLETKLAPWLDRFAEKLPELMPKLERLIDGAAKLADWFAENPFKGMGAVILAAIGKDLASAGIGTATRSAITAAVQASMPGGGGLAAASAGGRLALGGAVAAGALAYGAAIAENGFFQGAASGEDVTRDLAAKVRAGKVAPDEVQRILTDANKRQDERGIIGNVGQMLASPFSDASAKAVQQRKVDETLTGRGTFMTPEATEDLRRAIQEATTKGLRDGIAAASRSLPQSSPQRGGTQ